MASLKSVRPAPDLQVAHAQTVGSRLPAGARSWQLTCRSVKDISLNATLASLGWILALIVHGPQSMHLFIISGSVLSALLPQPIPVRLGWWAGDLESGWDEMLALEKPPRPLICKQMVCISSGVIRCLGYTGQISTARVAADDAGAEVSCRPGGRLETVEVQTCDPAFGPTPPGSLGMLRCLARLAPSRSH